MKFNRLPAELRDLDIGLKRLDFQNNFKSFEAQITIGAGAEVAIQNQMSPIVPSKRIIARQSAGNNVISDGNTKWDQSFVYLKNEGASSVTLTVIFLE